MKASQKIQDLEEKVKLQQGPNQRARGLSHSEIKLKTKNLDDLNLAMPDVNVGAPRTFEVDQIKMNSQRMAADR